MALPSLTTLLLAKPPSDWSTAITSLTTLLLAKAPSDWSTAHLSHTALFLYCVICPLIGQQLFQVLPPSYWLKYPLIGQ